MKKKKIWKKLFEKWSYKRQTKTINYVQTTNKPRPAHFQFQKSIRFSESYKTNKKWPFVVAFGMALSFKYVLAPWCSVRCIWLCLCVVLLSAYNKIVAFKRKQKQRKCTHSIFTMGTNQQNIQKSSQWNEAIQTIISESEGKKKTRFDMCDVDGGSGGKWLLLHANTQTHTHKHNAHVHIIIEIHIIQYSVLRLD